MEIQQRGPKSPVESVGVMGGFSSFLSVALAAYFSYQNTGTVGDAESVALISAAIGAGLSIYGRLKARRPVSF